MSDKRPINVDDAYALETPEDNVDLYKKWADSYDSDFVEREGYVQYLRVTELLLEQRADIKGAVLDIGCGTGVVGEALRAAGIDSVDGIDISPEMLAVAGQKMAPDGTSVYRGLIEADLTKRIDIPDDAYGALISAGTFTHGHLGPESFDELWRVAAPGAPCSMTVRSTHYDTMGFADRLAADVASGIITEPELTRINIYADATNTAHADDQAFVVVCRVV